MHGNTFFPCFLRFMKSHFLKQMLVTKSVSATRCVSYANYHSDINLACHGQI